MNFVFDGVTPGGGTGSSGQPFDPTTAYDWTAQQSFQITETTNNIPFRIVPDSVADTYSRPFNFVGGSFANTDSSKNFVVRLGHNIANGGGALDGTRSTLQDEWEQHYVAGGIDVVERHLAFTPVGGSIQRFITFIGRSDGVAPSTPQQNSLGFNVDNIYMSNRTNTTEYFRVDALAGFLIRNLSQGLKVEATTAGNGLALSAAAPYTGNFFELNYASFGFMSVNSYGEWNVQGNGKTGVSGNASHFDIRPRTESATAFIVRSSDGTPRITVNTTGNQVTISASSEMFCSSQFSVLSGTRQFTVTSAGAVRINQAATATGPVGTVVQKWPIYNTSGTLLGYIPIYDAIT